MELGLSRLPWYGQIVVFHVVTTLGFLVLQVYWFGPVEAKMAARRQDIEQRRRETADVLGQTGRLDGVRMEVLGLQERLESARSMLFDERSARSFLRRVPRMAMRAGLSVRALVPDNTESAPSHAIWSVRLEFIGTYHGLGDFLAEVTTRPQAVAIEEIVIEALETPRGAATIRGELLATMHVIPEGTGWQSPGIPPA